MFNGAGVAIVTPFNEGKIDFDAYEELIEFQIENNTQAIIVLGTTGEAATVNFEEREALVKLAVKKIAGRVPVIVGTGTNSTQVTIDNSIQAEALGADGLLVVTPYYNKCTQKGLIEHFTAIANKTKLPIILYNVISRTGVNIDPTTVLALSKVKNIVAIKEASGNIPQVLEIKRLVSEDFKIYSGNDDQIIPIYSYGGHGVISVASNVIPKEMQEICQACMDGDYKEALRIQLKYKPFMDMLFYEVNPIPVKAAVSALGYSKNELRLPLTPIEENGHTKLLDEMRKVNII